MATLAFSGTDPVFLVGTLGLMLAGFCLAPLSIAAMVVPGGELLMKMLSGPVGLVLFMVPYAIATFVVGWLTLRLTEKASTVGRLATGLNIGTLVGFLIISLAAATFAAALGWMAATN
ncbi:MAG: hypothetical protein EOP18_04870 [Rhizobiaceae bacterium]|nr:MAG: hypothetical protein EOP18_04870 [Rhizobiaceae bacterium]